MKNFILYGSIAVLTVGSIGLFYGSLSSNSTNKLLSVNQKEKVNWPKSYKKLTSNSDTNQSIKKDTNSTKHTVDNALPPEIQKVEKEVNTLDDEASEVLAYAKELDNQTEHEKPMIDKDKQRANEILAQLDRDKIIDKAKIEESVSTMLDPISEDEMPPAIRKVYKEAKKSTLELEKKLNKLKNEGK